jgi:hypothetical protein
MQTEPEQWAVTEADIEGAPDWAFSLASTIVLGNYGCGHAAVLIQRAFEERERKLREALKGIETRHGWCVEKCRACYFARQSLKETPMLNEAMKAEGWIEHDGGPCPVPLDSRPIYMMRDGVIDRSQLGTAASLIWDNRVPECDQIIAYKPEATHD